MYITCMYGVCFIVSFCRCIPLNSKQQGPDRHTWLPTKQMYKVRTIRTLDVHQNIFLQIYSLRFSFLPQALATMTSSELIGQAGPAFWLKGQQSTVDSENMCRYDQKSRQIQGRDLLVPFLLSSLPSHFARKTYRDFDRFPNSVTVSQPRLLRP
jgi:hypothetical protein